MFLTLIGWIVISFTGQSSRAEARAYYDANNAEGISYIEVKNGQTVYHHEAMNPQDYGYSTGEAR